MRARRRSPHDLASGSADAARARSGRRRARRPREPPPHPHGAGDRTCRSLALGLARVAVLGWARSVPGDLAIFAGAVRPDRSRRHRRASTASSRTAASRRAPRPRPCSAILGSAAIEGPVISWVADHRKHHAFSDAPGDPHSPHVDHGVGLRGALRGLRARTHRLAVRARPARRARPLRARPAGRPASCASSTAGSPCWALGGWRGGLRSRVRCSAARWEAGLTAAAVGRRDQADRCCTTSRSASTRSATSSAAGASRPPDESRNVFWLSLITFGESWHNNHHAFPTSARHGMGRWELDPSALVIRGLARRRPRVGRCVRGARSARPASSTSRGGA